jgi:hypothetical protein
MARRPNRDDVLVPVPGYKIEYKYASTDPSSGPSNIEITNSPFVQGFSEQLGPDLGEALSAPFINGDAFSPGNINGKVPMKESLFDVVSFFQLNSIQRHTKQMIARLKPFFQTMEIPRTVDGVYVTFYFIFKEDRNPLTKGCVFSISLPVKGNGRPMWSLKVPDGGMA